MRLDGLSGRDTDGRDTDPVRRGNLPVRSALEREGVVKPWAPLPCGVEANHRPDDTGRPREVGLREAVALKVVGNDRGSHRSWVADATHIRKPYVARATKRTPTMLAMSRAEHVDREVRDRLRAWLKYFCDRHGSTQDAFAEHIGIAGPSLSLYLNGRRTIGLDVLLKMSARCRRSIDEIVDTWPPTTEATKAPPDPREASTVSAGPRGRRSKKLRAAN
jgi:transcriptional regulator with XRE-family HTH domain